MAESRHNGLTKSSIYDVAPVIAGGGKEQKPQAYRPRKVSVQPPPYLASRFARRSFSKTSPQDERVFEKWATLWRLIILSSLGKTLYPYSQYIRTLNLGDLKQLITDSEYGKTKYADESTVFHFRSL